MRYIAKDNEELYKNIDYVYDKNQIAAIKQLTMSKSFTTK